MPHFIVGGYRDMLGRRVGNLTVMYSKRRPGKSYPHSSDRQEERARRQGLHSAMVNGFEIMQRLPSRRPS